MDNSKSVAEIIQDVSKQLSVISEEPQLESQLIIMKAMGCEKASLFAHPEIIPSERQLEGIQTMTAQRCESIPLPYILGEWDFFGHRFFVNQSVLIPRPETELLIETANEWLQTHNTAKRLFDIGTGSGCIAVSLSLNWPNKKIIASDISFSALKTAHRNAARYNVLEQVTFIQSDLDSAFTGTFDLLLANLPYIPTEICRNLSVFHFEPHYALDGGEDGFIFYRRLFESISRKMANPACIICEIESSQEAIAINTAYYYFPEAKISIRKDISNLPRALIISNS